MAVRGNCVGRLGSTVSPCAAFWAVEAVGAANRAPADASRIARRFITIPSCSRNSVDQRASNAAPWRKLRFDKGELSPHERTGPRGERGQAPAISSRSTFTPGPIVELTDSFMTNLPLAPVG